MRLLWAVKVTRNFPLSVRLASLIQSTSLQVCTTFNLDEGIYELYISHNLADILLTALFLLNLYLD